MSEWIDNGLAKTYPGKTAQKKSFYMFTSDLNFEL